MRLADALAAVSDRTLQPYRQALGRPAASGSEVAAALTTPAQLERSLHSLTAGPQTALRILWFNAGTSALPPWYFQSLYPRGRSMETPEAAIAALVTRGLAIPPPVLNGGFALVEDVAPALEALASGAWLDEAGFYLTPDEQKDAESGAQAGDPAAVVADMARLLGVLRSGIRIRQNEPRPYQADLRRMLAAADAAFIPPQPPTPFERGPLPWGDYPGPLAPLFAAAVSHDLVVSDGNVWRASPRAAKWVQAPPAEQWRALVLFWRRFADNASLNPHSRRLFALLRQGRWCRPGNLVSFLLPYLSEEPLGTLWALAHGVLMDAGIRLGILEWATPPDGPGGQREAGGYLRASTAAVRLRPEALAALNGEPLTTFPNFGEAPRVQGTFDVLAGPRTPPETIWTLEGWAERVSLDRFATYRLTRASVTAASRRGDSIDRLLAALAASPGGVPQNVAFTVSQWADVVGRADLGMAVVLTISETRQAERAAGGSALRACERLGPTAWRVPSEQLGPLCRYLEAEGFQIDGDLQALRDRLRASQHTGFRPPLPNPSLSWPGKAVPSLPLPGDPGEPGEPEPQDTGRDQPARPAPAAPQETPRAVAAPRPATAVPVATADRASPPMRPTGPPPARHSLAAPLPPVVPLGRAAVRRALEIALASGQPVGLLDVRGRAHLLRVQRLDADAVEGVCSRCGTAHRLPLADIAASGVRLRPPEALPQGGPQAEGAQRRGGGQLPVASGRPPQAAAQPESDPGEHQRLQRQRGNE